MQKNIEYIKAVSNFSIYLMKPTGHQCSLGYEDLYDLKISDTLNSIRVILRKSESLSQKSKKITIIRAIQELEDVCRLLEGMREGAMELMTMH
jgi:hypothetical protein